MVRQNHDRLITTEEDLRRRLISTKTGGTTGEPLWLMQEPDYIDFNAAQYYHKMSWSGWDLGKPHAWLWGHAVVGAGAQATLATRAKDWLANRTRSNAFQMTKESMEQLASQLEKHPGGVIWSYASTLYRFAKFLQQRGHHIEVCGAYTGAEAVYEHQRELIEQTLGCDVFSSYSCVEIGSIACECEKHEGLHFSTRTCYLEVLRDGEPVPDGEEGEFALTSLTHYGFPLIRYKLEDWGKKSLRQCSCGRGLPLLDVVGGRILDLFKTRDGEYVNTWAVIPMVPLLGPVKQYQIVQKTVDLVVLRVVKAGPGPIDEERFKDIQKALKTILGDNVEARLEFVDSLPATPTGKHRFTVSEVDKD